MQYLGPFHHHDDELDAICFHNLLAETPCRRDPMISSFRHLDV
jgi:hypothetical protein